jgi:hypothetical protein
MIFQVVFHSVAKQEYEESYLWYEQEQVGLGDRFEKRTEQILLQITQYPEHYGYSKIPYREATIEGFPYTIVYKLNKRKRQIFISAIYHTKRHPKHKYRK